LILGVVSAGVGYVFGGTSEILYGMGKQADGAVGSISGIAFGFVVGICYVLFLGKFLEKKRTRIDMDGYCTLFGVAAGVICSVLVHGFLMISYEETSFLNMAIGTGFGACAGAALGWIGSGIIKFFYKGRVLVEVCDNDGRAAILPGTD